MVTSLRWWAAPADVRRRIALAVFALVILACGSAWSAAARADGPVKRLAGCDPIDPALCLLPYPNDYFTRPDRTSATGLRLHIRTIDTPRNQAGQPILTTDWNR